MIAVRRHPQVSRDADSAPSTKLHKRFVAALAWSGRSPAVGRPYLRSCRPTRVGWGQPCGDPGQCVGESFRGELPGVTTDQAVHRT